MATTYRVLGMSCEGCAKSVTNAIKAVASDAEVNVDLEAKSVSVGGSVDSAVVEQAVDDAGFEFAGPA
ncbi:MAG: heavy-metal-associated domain-containing protein [Rhodospirillales bacterium]|nr:heavy-metal-associated domain-containing protein [Rhodospirillales bacterium]